MSDRHLFWSDNFYVGSDNVRCLTVILSTANYINELILTPLRPFDIKCKILGMYFRASRRVSFSYFPKVAFDNVCVYE